MFTRSEMIMLQHMSHGVNTVKGLTESLEVTKPRVYALVTSLREKGAVYLDYGTIIPEKHTYLGLLMTMLHDHESLSDDLSVNGMDLLAELLEGKTVTELSDALDEGRVAVRSRLKILKSSGLVYKDGRTYRINDALWPELRKMISEYDVYRKTALIRHLNKLLLEKDL